MCFVDLKTAAPPDAAREANTTDFLLEVDISRSYLDLITQHTEEGRAAAWQTMRSLIFRRSPKAIARLKRHRGLVRP